MAENSRYTHLHARERDRAVVDHLDKLASPITAVGERRILLVVGYTIFCEAGLWSDGRSASIVRRSKISAPNSP